MTTIEEAITHLAPVAKLVLAYTVAGLCLEAARPAQSRQPWRRILFNLAYLPVYLTSLVALAPAVAIWLPASPALMSIDWTSTLAGAVAQTVIFALAYDFFYYWWHRAQHTFAPLWAIHRLHHTEQALNVTTAARHHWLEESLRPLVVLLPLGWLFHFQPVQYATIGLVFAAWPFFIHLNVPLRLGPLGRLIMGPQYHRIHHSIEPQHWNRNFGAFFPAWDYLFGTAWHPKRDEFPATGISDQDGEPRSAAREALTAPFAEWWRLWRTRTAHRQ